MLGFIKKDLLLVKANFKTLFIVIFAFILMTIMGTFDLIFILPVIGVMVFAGTFNYDDYNGFNAYAVALPNGRKNMVRGKYASSIILLLGLIILSLLISILKSVFNSEEIVINNLLLQVMGSIFSIVIIISLMYPLIWKFGSTNGRVWLFALVFLMILGFGFISNYISSSAFLKIGNVIDRYFYIVVPVLSVIMLLVSYVLSVKIYNKKEF